MRPDLTANPVKLKTPLFFASALFLSHLTAWGGGSSAEPDPLIKVEITRTAYGVPHIVGKDIRSATYGLAYAYAQDNICIAADRFMTVAGERSKYLGGDVPAAVGSTVSNLRSDFYHRNILDLAAIDQAYGKVGPVGKEAIAGYVGGYNRFLADAKESDLGECAAAAWARRSLTENDLKRHLLALVSPTAVMEPPMFGVMEPATGG